MIIFVLMERIWNKRDLRALKILKYNFYCYVMIFVALCYNALLLHLFPPRFSLIFSSFSPQMSRDTTPPTSFFSQF